MISTLDLKKMTVQEKLQLMELIWSDLESNSETIPMPEWHKEVLEKREKEIREGKAKFIDWEDAKKELNQAINEDNNSR